MVKVVDRYNSSDQPMVVISDFTPPRSGDPSAVDRAQGLNVDFICVAYNPGKLVRADPVATAVAVKERLGKEAVFNLATRDMNKVALGTRLLGAHMLGVENVVVVRGDPFTEQEAVQVKPVDDYAPTRLIRDVQALNEGIDYRGSKLRGATEFCIGASLDLERDLEQEARLALRKVEAGAQFFITQPFYDLSKRERFLALYETASGRPLTQPVFWGLQVLDRDGIVLGAVPSGLRAALDAGKPGTEIATEVLKGFLDAGIRGVYLVPPILRGGARDYDAAQKVLVEFGR